MMERVQRILEIASNENGPLKSADEVEEMLIEQMRRLGHSTMSQWAMTAEERVSTELQSQDPTMLSRKKNAEVVVRLWTHRSARANLGQRHVKLSTTTTRTIGSKAPRAFPSRAPSQHYSLKPQNRLVRCAFDTVIWGRRLDDLESVVETIAACGYRGIEFAQNPADIFVRDSARGLFRPL